MVDNLNRQHSYNGILGASLVRLQDMMDHNGEMALALSHSTPILKIYAFYGIPVNE